MGLSEITAGKVQEYRIHRHRGGDDEARQAAGPQHHASGNRLPPASPEDRRPHGWLDHLPDLSEPYRSSPKISHRAWFSPEEYKKLYEATRERAHEPKKARYKWEVRTASRLRAVHGQHRPAARRSLAPPIPRRDHRRGRGARRQTSLKSRCAGKRGVGYCKSMHRRRAAVRAAEGQTPSAQERKERAGGHNQHDLAYSPQTFFRNGSANCSRRSWTRRISRSTAKASPARPTACATPTSVCA